jgi:hypothetical protein
VAKPFEAITQIELEIRRGALGHCPACSHKGERIAADRRDEKELERLAGVDERAGIEPRQQHVPRRVEGGA